MITIRLIRRDYDILADKFVPIGEQINLSREEVKELLRSRTRAFTEEEIAVKFASKAV